MIAKVFNEIDSSLLSKTLRKLIATEISLTPSSLASKLGIPTNKITRIINEDVTDPRASTLIQIASYFDVTINELLGLEPIKREYS